MFSAPHARIKVVFLTFYYEAWDALADVWRLMSTDDRFDVSVVSIPRRFSGHLPFGEEDDVSAFLDSVGVPHERFDFADSFEGLERLKQMAPDYVFLNYPWQRNYQPGYRAEHLSEFTKIAYVPYYSLPLVNEPGVVGVAPHMVNQRSHQLASLIFAPDQSIVDAFATTSRGNSHVHLTGSPKIDALVREVEEEPGRWPLPGDNNFRMVWAPHHSYSAAWLNFGVFADVYREMLAFARTEPDLEIVLRPHPFLFSTLVDREVIPEFDLALWLAEWEGLPNTTIDTDGDSAHLFKAADLFVTDGISFLGEYPLATGKPTVFMENPEHWDFSPIGEIAAAANIRVGTFGQFETVFREVREHGLPDYSAEIRRLREAARPFPGQAAARIVESVAADFAAGTPLVDKSIVTEVPWESRPEAEPAWD
jgi:hypothetical protein